LVVCDLSQTFGGSKFLETRSAAEDDGDRSPKTKAVTGHRTPKRFSGTETNLARLIPPVTSAPQQVGRRTIMAPRTPSARLPFLFAVPFLLSLAPIVRAQDNAAKLAPQAPAKTAPAKAGKSKESSAAAKAKKDEQKALALSLLVTLSNDARSYQDQKLRARTLSRIADALWDSDPEQGRALFRKAWDAAEVADQETARKVDEDRQRQQAGNPNGQAAVAGGPDVRAEVLRLAARNDRALGEELLDKLKEARARETTDATSPAAENTLNNPTALRQRVQLANQLLDTDVERAIQFADPVLRTVSMEALSFLSALRDKNPAAADQRYARMLAIAETDLKSDANTVSLLSSYLFTPQLFVVFAPDGGQSSSSMNRRAPPPEVAPELRDAYFRIAAEILLRPSPSKEQDHSTSGLQGKFLVIRRLLPLFEQYAPKEIAVQLRSEMAVLGQGVESDVRELNEDNPIQPANTPERRAEDVEKSLLDRLERAKTSEERDAIYLQLASRTAQRGDLRARDFADKIEDSELRKQAKPYVDMNLAMKAVEKKDIETALLLAGKGELSHIQKVWLMTEAAKAMPPADREKALDTLTDALGEARRIDVGDADRPRALVAAANAFLLLDRARAWETMLEVAKAANSAEGFNGEDGRIMMRLQSKNMTSMHTSGVNAFNLPGIFRELAKENATQAIEIARSFEGEAPRATALIAVARQLLSEEPAAGASPPSRPRADPSRSFYLGLNGIQSER
jgi:hypothetical protein